MRYLQAVKRTWKKSFISAVITLPLFIPIFLYVINPFWPKNVIGWIIVAAIPVVIEAFYAALYFYAYELNKEEGSSTVSWWKLLKLIVIMIPVTIIAIVLIMKGVSYIQFNYFEIK